MDIQERCEEIRDRLAAAATRAGRAPASVQLIAVTKTRSVEEIVAAVDAGVTDVGENKVQEAERKKPELERPIRWHLVGHLQKNKASKALETFDVIHSVDSVAIGQRLDRLAGESGSHASVLVQVDLAAEDTKFGVPAEALLEALESLRTCDHLSVDGLMTLPPYLPEAEDVRPYFRRLRELSHAARERGLAGPELSMGMSHDFEVAIEEGATFVRVGTAIFGPRPAKVEGAEQVV